MEKLWIKKELYFLSYEVLNFYIFFGFYLIFNQFLLNFFNVISYLKSQKRGVYLTQDRKADMARDADVVTKMTWRAGPTRMQHVTKATWQSCAWPTRGAGRADKWQEATRVHADAREGHHVAGGLASEGPW